MEVKVKVELCPNDITTEPQLQLHLKARHSEVRHTIAHIRRNVRLDLHSSARPLLFDLPRFETFALNIFTAPDKQTLTTMMINAEWNELSPHQVLISHSERSLFLFGTLKPTSLISPPRL